MTPVEPTASGLELRAAPRVRSLLCERGKCKDAQAARRVGSLVRARENATDAKGSQALKALGHRLHWRFCGRPLRNDTSRAYSFRLGAPGRPSRRFAVPLLANKQLTRRAAVVSVRWSGLGKPQQTRRAARRSRLWAIGFTGDFAEGPSAMTPVKPTASGLELRAAPRVRSLLCERGKCKDAQCSPRRVPASAGPGSGNATDAKGSQALKALGHTLYWRFCGGPMRDDARKAYSFRPGAPGRPSRPFAVV